ncbi:MAG: phosphopantetheine-binding protein [Candidatus Methylacidiphilales bacterium]
MSLTDQEKQDLQESFRRCRPGTLDAIFSYRQKPGPDTLETVVYGIIDRYMPPESPMKIDDADDDTLLADDLGIDSLTMLEIVLSIEEALGVKVDDSELQSIRTLGEVKTYLLKKAGGESTQQEKISSNRSFQRENLELILPQQPPFLFLDTAQIEGGWVRASYTPDSDETFFLGHFRDEPVLPASILFEAMGQAGCLYVLEHPEAREAFTISNRVYFASMDGAKFFRKVLPKEKVTIEVKLKSLRAPLAIFSAKASVKGEKVASVQELVLVFGEIADHSTEEDKTV